MRKIVVIVALILFASICFTTTPISVYAIDEHIPSEGEIQQGINSIVDSQNEGNLQMIVSGYGIPYTILSSCKWGSVGFKRNTHGGASLIYYDHESMTYGYLTDQSVATCDNNNPGWIDNSFGGLSPIINEKEIIVIKAGDTTTDYWEGTGSYFLKMSPDGSNKRIFQLEMTESIEVNSGIVYDGKDFYFVMNKYNGKDDFPIASYLCKTDIETGKYTVLSEQIETNTCISIVGTFQNKLIVMEMSISEKDKTEPSNTLIYRYYLYDCISQNYIFNDMQWAQGELTIVFDGGYAYYCTQSNPHLMRINIITGEKEEKTFKVSEENAKFILLSACLDNHIIFYGFDQEKKNPTPFCYDVNTEEIKQLQLTYHDSDGVEFLTTICSECEDYFLVMCGASYVLTEDQLADGTKYEYEAREEQYGLISKEDYWDSIDNIIPFTLADSPMVNDNYRSKYGC